MKANHKLCIKSCIIAIPVNQRVTQRNGLCLDYNPAKNTIFAEINNKMSVYQ